MRAAADRCMNIGLCRKTASGVMCPSFMATRDEEHATRGRANALVMALVGAGPEGSARRRPPARGSSTCAWSARPASASARSGSTWRPSRPRRWPPATTCHGVPTRARLFAAVRRLNALGSALAPLSNLPGRSRPARTLAAAGARRSPRPGPCLASGATPCCAGWPAVSAPAGPFPLGEVVFLADSFTTWTEPAIPIAAVELLELAGWRVRVEQSGCCGRASISKGLLDQASELAARMSARLAPVRRAGRADRRGRAELPADPA